MTLLDMAMTAAAVILVVKLAFMRDLSSPRAEEEHQFHKAGDD